MRSPHVARAARPQRRMSLPVPAFSGGWYLAFLLQPIQEPLRLWLSSCGHKHGLVRVLLPTASPTPRFCPCRECTWLSFPICFPYRRVLAPVAAYRQKHSSERTTICQAASFETHREAVCARSSRCILEAHVNSTTRPK